MGNISELTEELLVKILTFLPTKVAVSTSILSKQWEFLWMWLPKLEYHSRNYPDPECKRLRCFLDRNLPLHRAPVIESLRLHFENLHVKPEYIKLWVLIAVSRYVRQLEIFYNFYLKEPDTLPSSLYTCKSLVTLKLTGTILLDVPRMVCRPCLKTLLLLKVTYFNEDSLLRLLSNCPALEDLWVETRKDDKMGKLTVIFPYLRRLMLSIPNDLVEFVINTPSLKYLKIHYYRSKSHHSFIENMPKLREAHVEVSFPFIKSLIGSITSVKHLELCLRLNSPMDVYGDGFVFDKLEHLKLCVCREHSLKVLIRLLKVSPNLRVLNLCEMEDHELKDFLVSWRLPSTVPKCMLSSLHTLEWSGYLGTPEERDLAIYILETLVA